MFSFPDYVSFARAFKCDRIFGTNRAYNNIMRVPPERLACYHNQNLGLLGNAYWTLSPKQQLLNGGIYSVTASMGMRQTNSGSLRVASIDGRGSLPITQALPRGMASDPGEYILIKYERDEAAPKGAHKITSISFHDLTFAEEEIDAPLVHAAIDAFFTYLNCAKGMEFAHQKGYPLPAMPDAAAIAWKFANAAELNNYNVAAFPTRPSQPHRFGARVLYNRIRQYA